MKIRPAGAELFHMEKRTEGQTDITKLIIAFRNSANALKNSGYLSLSCNTPESA